MSEPTLRVVDAHGNDVTALCSVSLVTSEDGNLTEWTITNNTAGEVYILSLPAGKPVSPS
jgi:hypothetical protein